MTEHRLVAGHIVTIFNGRERTPTDEAVIHIEGDEDSEIEIHCPDAPILADKIVKAVNSHEALVKALIKIASMDLKGVRADDLGRAARIASEAIRDFVGCPLTPSEGK